MKTKNLFLIFKIIIGILLLILLFKKIDFLKVLTNFKKVNFSLMLIIFILTLAGQIFLVLRWQIILTKLKSRCAFWKLFKAYFIGLFFNIFLPATVGADAVKGYVLYKDNKKLQISFFSVFVDRYIGLFSLIFLAFISSFFVKIDYKNYPLSLWMFCLVLIFLITSFILTTPWVRRIIISKRDARFFYTIANSVSKAIKFVIKSKKTLGICLFYSLASYLTVVLIHYFLAKGLGYPVGFKVLLVLVPVIAICSMAPVSINGIGLREFIYIYLFSGYGWDSNTAVSICWIIFVIFLLLSAFGGIFYMFVGTEHCSVPTNKDFS